MSQMSFSDAEYASKRKTTRREAFLAEMEQVVPWASLLELIEPFYPVAGRGRHPYPLETMLRVHLMQNWFGLSDPATEEEALYEIASMRVFAGLRLGGPIPDETTILNFRRLLETHELAPAILRRVNAYLTRKGLMLKRGTIVDATIISAPSSTKNASGERDPEMHQASIRARVEHPFRVIKCQFGLLKVRFRGLAKDTAHLLMLFALSNLWMARKKLMAIAAYY
jgi:IS5 family transposase